MPEVVRAAAARRILAELDVDTVHAVRTSS
jgi:hypothetical protein